MKNIFILLFCLFLPLSALADGQGLYAYETAEGMKVGAVFGAFPKLAVDDELVAATSPICDHVEIHQMKEIDGIMKMRQISSMPVDAAGQAVLSATGNHLMLMQLKEPIREGKAFPLVLVFKNAGEVKVDVPVISRKMK